MALSPMVEKAMADIKDMLDYLKDAEGWKDSDILMSLDSVVENYGGKIIDRRYADYQKVEDWKVGDKLIHPKYGFGKVKDRLGTNIKVTGLFAEFKDRNRFIDPNTFALRKLVTDEEIDPNRFRSKKLVEDEEIEF